MKLSKWLRPLRASVNDIKCIIWDQDYEDKPLYEGSISKIPWDIADSHFADLDKADFQIEPRHISKNDTEKTLIIIVKYYDK